MKDYISNSIQAFNITDVLTLFILVHNIYIRLTNIYI